MGLGVWFREDVARALQAAYVAEREVYLALGEADPSSGEDKQRATSRELAAYRRGYEAALATLVAAFGLDAGEWA